MNSRSDLRKTAPVLGRSNIYDSADGTCFSANDLWQSRGNIRASNLSALSHFSFLDDEDIWDDEERNEEFENNRTKTGKTRRESDANKDTRLARSVSDVRGMRMQEGSNNRDIVGISEQTSMPVSETGTFTRGHLPNMPTWRKMVQDPGFAAEYLSRQWPRISLRSSFKKKAPYVAPDEEDNKTEQVTKEETLKGSKKKLITTTVLVVLGVVLVAAAMIPVVLISELYKNDSELKDYVRVDMNATLNKTYSSKYEDKTSTEYKTLTEEFCSEIGTTYVEDNRTQSSYYGCKVTDVREGSVIVVFTIYFTGTSIQLINRNAETVLQSNVEANNNRLGHFLIIIASIHIRQVKNERLGSPPDVQGIFAHKTTEVTELTPVASESTTMSSSSFATESSTRSVTSSTSKPTTKSGTSKESETTTMSESSSGFKTTTMSETNPESETTIITTIIRTSSASSTMSEASSASDTTIISETSSPSSTILGTSPASKMTTMSDTNSLPETTMSGTSSASETKPIISETSSVSKITTYSETSLMSKTTTISETSSILQENTTMTTRTTTSEDTDTTNEQELTTDDNTSGFTNKATRFTNQGTKMHSSNTDHTTNTLLSTPSTTVYLIESTQGSDIDDNTSKSTPMPTKIQSHGSTESKTDKTTEPVSFTNDQTSELFDLTSARTVDKTTSNPSNALSVSSYKVTQQTSSVPTFSELITSRRQTTTKFTTNVDLTLQTASKTSTASTFPEPITGLEQAILTTDHTDFVTDKDILDTELPRTTEQGAIITEDTTSTIKQRFNTIERSSSLTTTKFTFDEKSSTINITDYTTVTGGTTDFTEKFLTNTFESTTADLNCPNTDIIQLYVDLEEFSVWTVIKKPYSYVRVYHSRSDATSSMFDITYSKNGAVYEQNRPNENITCLIVDTMITLKISDASNLYEGSFTVFFLSASLGEVAKKKFVLQDIDNSETPTITLNPDQVIDLVFNNDDSDYFRDTGLHSCQGNTGNSLSNWEIDITYDGTNFEDLPEGYVTVFSRTNVTTRCVHYQRIEFAVKFKEYMKNAHIRCKNSGVPIKYKISNELQLIPRNICNCGEDGHKRGHPDNCNVYVKCIKDSSGIYPFGKACPDSQCRMSENGNCTTNCSSAVCDEKPDEDFCIPTPAPTTKAPPSLYVNCQNKVFVELDTGPASITCTLNSTAYSILNITSRLALSGTSTVIGQIDNTGNFFDLVSDDSVTAVLSEKIVTISIERPNCTSGDVYGVHVIVDSDNTGSSSGTLVVGNRPKEPPSLYLDPDQVEGLGINEYRNWLHHSCSGVIGYPSGKFVLEILKDNDKQFTQLDFYTEMTDPVEVDACSNKQEIKFEIRFTSDMNNAIIRCGIVNDNFGNYTTLYSNNETVSLIPDRCKNNSEGKTYYPHPTICKYYVQCFNSKTLGKACSEGTCFGVNPVARCIRCGDAICPSDVTTPSPTLPMTTMESSPSGISCRNTSAVIYSENVNLECNINQTVFESVNINFVSSVGSISMEIATISRTRDVTYHADQNDFVVQFVDTLLTITVKNVSCSIGGKYIVNVNMTDSFEEKFAWLLVLVEPSGQATLTMHPEQIINVYYEGSLHVCQADVGNPPGKISIEMRLQGENSYSNLTSLKEMGEPNTLSQCSYQKTYNFLVNFTSEMENATVRCRVTNKHFNALPPIFSNSETLALVPGDFCFNKTQEFNQHPTDQECRRYVWCTGSELHVQNCNPSCFNPNVGRCDHCQNVDTCP